MTVEDNTSRNQYTATSGQTVFAYTFEIVDKDDIVVLKNGTALSEGTDYTVSNVGNDSGGNVTLTTGATTGDILTLYRDMPYARTQNYTNSGDFLASEVNSDFDNLWLAGEQTNRSFSQSIRKPITDSDSISMELPEAANRANKFLVFDDNGAVTVDSASAVSSTIESQQFTGDGTTTAFTLSAAPGSRKSVVIHIDGVYQESTTYTVSGAVITFTEAPPLNASIEVLFFKVGDITADVTAEDVSIADAGGYYTSGNVEGALQEVGADITTIESEIDDLEAGRIISVTDYGATGDGTTDDTTAIQNAINAASKSNTATGQVQTIFFPDGHYKFSTLRFYYDATDNPGFESTENRDGRFQIRGTGRLSINDLKNYDGTNTDRLYGAVLESTGDGIILTESTTRQAQNFVAKDITIIANNTGNILKTSYSPGLTFDHCSFKQLNSGGNGLQCQNTWFLMMNQCYVFGDTSSGSPAANTGYGIELGITTLAGEFTIIGSSIDSWQDGLIYDSSAIATNISIRDTAIQNCNQYGIYVFDGTIAQLLLDNVYFENQANNTDIGQGTSFIKDNDAADFGRIRNLRMNSCFFLGGHGPANLATTTGPMIDLDKIDAVQIEGCFVYRMFKAFLNVTDTINAQSISGEVKNCLFLTDKDLSAEPTVFLLTGILPNVHNCLWPGYDDGIFDTTNNVQLFDSTTDGQYLREYTDLVSGATNISKFSFGDTNVETVTSSPYTISDFGGNEAKTYFDLTHSIAGGLQVRLPDSNEKGDGRLIIVKNNEATTSTSQFPYINVVNNSDQATTIARLSPGQAGLFVFDGQDSGVFKYVGRTFSDDLELTDDHKITFGRGTASGPDMEIYHDSTSGESRIDTLAGLTLNGLTYPTADGTANQVLTTDGSGTLSFATPAGGFDPNVDQVVIGNGAAGNANPIFSSVAIGHDATASGTYAVGLGNQALATGADSVALGNDAHATGAQSVALGDDSVSGSNATIAIGNLANSSSAYGVAIGYNAQTSGAGNHYGVAIGRDSGAMAANTIHISSAATTTNRPTVAGNMVIETDDARLQYKSSTWSFFGGPIEVNGNINFGDSEEAVFGADTDMRIFHNGTTAFVKNTTGTLALQTDTFSLQNAAGTATHIFVNGTSGYTSLGYGGVVKLNTSTAGVNVSGNVAISNGNGIDFSANPNAPGMTSELLDDYEEGTWTPTITGATTNPTITYATNGQVGRYTKIGNKVFLQFTITTTAISGGVGFARIAGLPFASVSVSGATSSGVIGLCTGFDNSTPTPLPQNHPGALQMQPGQSVLILRRRADSDGPMNATCDTADFANVLELMATIAYETS